MTDESVTGNTVVRYTVKELLSEIRDGINKLEGKLDSKADKSEVAALGSRLAKVESTVSNIQATDVQRRTDRSEATERVRWALPFGAALLIAIPDIIGRFFH